MINKSRTLCFILLLILLSVWGINAFADNRNKILIVANGKSPAYQQVINSFEKLLSNETNNITVHYLSAIKDKTDVISSEINESKPDLIFTLGVASTKIAMQTTSEIPIITTMVVKSHFFQQSSNVTGVVLAYPLSTQFKWLQKILPDFNNVAILYNPEENLNTIKKAKHVANKIGLEITAIPVDTAKQLPYALKQLAKNIQVLLAIPDRVVTSPKTAKAVLLASFRNRVPMIGLTENWVKAGALYALSWNYTDIGKQCANQAITILKDKSIKHTPIAFPEKIEYVINKTIMERMNIQLSEPLLNNAKKVFK